MLSLPSARYRCTSCGDCCRGWGIPLETGEAAAFKRLAAPLVPAERLVNAVTRVRQGGQEIEILAGGGRSCAALQEDQLCAIHGAHGEAAKPKVCRVFPLTFTATPTAVRVGLSYACPAVIDAEGSPLTEQRAEIEAVFAAVDGSHHVVRVGEQVHLADGLDLPWKDAERFIAELAASFRAGGTLAERASRAAAIAAQVRDQLREGAAFDAALAAATEGAPALVAEFLAEPPEVDRMTHMLFRTLVKSTERQSAARVIGTLFSSLFGGGTLRLRTGGEVAWRDVEAVAPGAGAEGEALLARWFAGSLEACTFFGPVAFDLSLIGGLSLLALSASVCVFLARAHAAHESRSSVTYEDVKRGLRQLDAGVTHRRSNMPGGFGRGVAGIASLDLLRTQLS